LRFANAPSLSASRGWSMNSRCGVTNSTSRRCVFPIPRNNHSKHTSHL
jgi:hypothetical protein